MDNLLPLSRIAQLTHTTSVERIESIQSLWSGYGEIVRVRLQDRDHGTSRTAIVKHVCPPESRDHKYGWSGDVSHQRKLSSYENEMNWYRNASQFCGQACRVPKLLAAESTLNNGDQPDLLLVLEDLDAAGFDLRHGRASDVQVDACLAWLANFHAQFLHDTTDSATTDHATKHDLWPIGTYWHLATRPDELAAMETGPLKQAAAKIDAKLNNARFQTLVHGDAKLANFCFSPDDQVSAVDFQYVGGGCGMKDVTYFISSCYSEDECGQRGSETLERYFAFLRDAVGKRTALTSLPLDALEQEWRSVYDFAWADFVRFLAGWSPGHWKMHSYSLQVAQRALGRLEPR